MFKSQSRYGSVVANTLLLLLTFGSLIFLTGCSQTSEKEQSKSNDLNVVGVEMMPSLNAALFESDRTSSYVGFSIKHLQIHSIRGNFERYHAAVLYNPEYPEKTSVTFRINVNSITTGVAMRDRDLNSERFFDQAYHPYITFQSKYIKKVKEGSFTAVGELTMKGVTKSQEIAFHITTPEVIVIPGRLDYVINIEGSAMINRNDFGVKRKNSVSGVLSDEVNLEFSLILRQQNFDAIDFNNSPKASIGAKMYELFSSGNSIEEVINAYTKLKNSNSDEYQTNQFDLEILGRKLMHHKKYDEALRIFELIAQQDSSFIRSYLKSAEIYGLKDNTQRSIEQLKKALLIDGTHPVAIELMRGFKSE